MQESKANCAAFCSAPMPCNISRETINTTRTSSITTEPLQPSFHLGSSARFPKSSIYLPNEAWGQHHPITNVSASTKHTKDFRVKLAANTGISSCFSYQTRAIPAVVSVWAQPFIVPATSDALAITAEARVSQTTQVNTNYSTLINYTPTTDFSLKSTRTTWI